MHRTALITLEYDLPGPSGWPTWTASTGHPDMPTGYLQGVGNSPTTALHQLADRIERDPVMFVTGMEPAT